MVAHAPLPREGIPNWLTLVATGNQQVQISPEFKMTSSKVPALSARIERFPIAGSFTISRGAKTEAVTVVAEVNRDGLTGRGECVPYPHYGETPEATLAAIQAMKEAVARGLTRQALQAAMPPGAARNALDCALIDLEARAAGLRAWSLLDRPSPGERTTAYTISLGTPEAMAAATAKAAHRPLLKIKLGGDGDGERIAAVREAAPESELIVDANEAWTEANLEHNLAVCEGVGVTLVEQPLPAGKDDALARIKRPLVVCADESVHDRHSLAPLRERYDAVNITRQDRRPHRGAGNGRCRSGARLRDHDRLHGRNLAIDGAGDAGDAAGALRRSRRPAAAGARPRSWPSLRRQPDLSAGLVAVGMSFQLVPRRPDQKCAGSGHRCHDVIQAIADAGVDRA
ncbi:O-succinylbenzoate synthase [Bradyrhizobium sp. RT5a]